MSPWSSSKPFGTRPANVSALVAPCFSAGLSSFSRNARMFFRRASRAAGDTFELRLFLRFNRCLPWNVLVPAQKFAQGRFRDQDDLAGQPACWNAPVANLWQPAVYRRAGYAEDQSRLAHAEMTLQTAWTRPRGGHPSQTLRFSSRNGWFFSSGHSS